MLCALRMYYIPYSCAREGRKKPPKAVCEERVKCVARYWGWCRRTPHPVIVTIWGLYKDYIRVLLYSYYTTITITGWGGPPKGW